MSPITPSVLAWAPCASEALDAIVTAIHVLQPAARRPAPAMAGPDVGDEGDAARLARAIQRNQEWLGHEASAARIDSARLDRTVIYGDAAECILDLAARQRASLVIVGHPDPIAGLPALLGRTVRHSLHEAKCAVLVVTPTTHAIASEYVRETPR